MNKFYKSVYGEPETLQISSDAYYFLLKGEQCLDEDNEEEALEIRSRYKYGFKFVSDPVAVDNSDLIEVEISPRVLQEVAEQYTHYFDFVAHWRVEYAYIDKNHAKLRFYNTKTGVEKNPQVCEVEINSAKKPQIKTNTGCIFPLWSNNKTHVIKKF